MQESKALQEPVKNRLGGSLSVKSPFERLAMLQRNADALLGDALLGDSWRGKDDGTLIRKVLGKVTR